MLLLVLIVLAVCGNTLWLYRDDTIFPDTDSYTYLSSLFSSLHDIRTDGFENPRQLVRTASIKGRPPLYQLLTAPIVLVFGRTITVALLVNNLFLAISMAACFRAARALAGTRAGLLAALLILSYPPSVHLSRAYRPHFAVLAALSVLLAVAIELVQTKSIRGAWSLALVTGIGLLIHPSFLWVATAPLIFTVIHTTLIRPREQGSPTAPSGARSWLLARLGDPFLIKGLLPAGAIAGVAVAAWYGTEGRVLLDALRELSSAHLYAFRGFTIRTVGLPTVDPSRWWYALTAPTAISWPLALAIPPALVYVVRKQGVAGLLITTTAVAGFLALSLQSSMGWIYGASLLPIAAIATGVWLGSIRPEAASRLATAMAASVALFCYGYVSWGSASGPDAHLAQLLRKGAVRERLCRTSRALCAAPPLQVDLPVDDALLRVLDDPKCVRRTCHLFVVYGSEVSAAMLSFYRVLLRPDQPLRVTSQLAADWGLSYPLAQLLESDYLFYPRLSTDHPTERIQKSYRLASIVLLEAPPEAFAKSHRIDRLFTLPSGRTAVLIRRVLPLTKDEALDTLDNLALDPTYKPDRAELLDRLRSKLSSGNRGSEAAPQPSRRAPSAPPRPDLPSLR